MANSFYRVRERRGEKKVTELKGDRVRFLRIQERGSQRQRNDIPLSTVNHRESSGIKTAASNSSIYENIADGSVFTKTYGDEEIPGLQYTYEDHVRSGFVPMVTYKSDDVMSNNVTQYDGQWEEEIDRLLETPAGIVGTTTVNISNDIEPEGILEHTDYQCDLNKDMYLHIDDDDVISKATNDTIEYTEAEGILQSTTYSYDDDDDDDDDGTVEVAEYDGILSAIDYASADQMVPEDNYQSEEYVPAEGVLDATAYSDRNDPDGVIADL